MDKRWFVAIPAACAALALGVWGGGDEDLVPGGGAPTSEEMAACLEAGGAADAQVYEEDEVGEAAMAVAPAGDVILLVNLPDPGIFERAERILKKKLRAEGVRDAGVPTLASEELAKNCASLPWGERS